MNSAKRVVLAAVLFLPASLPSVPSTGQRVSAARVVGLTERIEAQRAVEAVLWRHRLWPAENLRPKPPVSEILSDAEIQAKVEDTLAKSSALEDVWRRPVTTAQLQAELDRMVRGSHDPALLREMFTALHDDAVLIAETIARPALTDRLAHRWYAYDARLHADVRTKAEEARAGAASVAELVRRGGKETDLTWTSSTVSKNDEDLAGRALVLDRKDLDAKVAQLARTYAVPPEALPVGRLSAIEETEEGFRVVTVLSKTEDRLTLATVEWKKTPFDTWWAGSARSARRTVPDATGPFSIAPPDVSTSCQPDSWSPIDGGDWTARSAPAFVWTGSEMIVWGGLTDTYTNTRLRTGFRYSPATDTWTPTAVFNSPAPRYGATAVWTGSLMIVWGSDQNLGAGGRYDPVSDSWHPTSVTGVPSGRSGHTAVWTGSEMIVWGGTGASGVTNTGARYDPVSDTWKSTSTGANVPTARDGHTAVWTGTEMIVWGGGPNGLSTGARYDPAADTWVPTSPSPASFRRDHTAVWTGTEMIVWGGRQSQGGGMSTGARYNPSTNTWQSTASTSIEPRFGHAAVWTGTEMIVWGGTQVSSELASGALYNPVTNTWRATPFGPWYRTHPVAVWTGTEMIVWGGQYFGCSLVSGGRFDPATNTWVATGPGYEPIGRVDPGTVWTGTEMIVLGGRYADNDPEAGFGQGGRYTPATDTWSATTREGAPPARSGHTVVWTGTEVIVWGGRNMTTLQLLGNGGRYDPTLDHWSSVTTTLAPTARFDHTAVWTGARMVVWGGDVNAQKLNDGSSYDPVADTWSAIASAGAPSARSGHTAVWTGSRMVVWGGSSLASGGRYDPSSNGWTPTAASPLAGRYGHSAVWTGNQMIVWGGRAAGTNAFGDGARYDPVSDQWTMVSATNAPDPRASHTAIWTGNQMIIWDGPFAKSGGASYAPSIDTWFPVASLDAPMNRMSPAVVWTGSRMIAWGGVAGSDVRVDGASYCPCPQVVRSYLDQDGDGYGAGPATITCDLAPGRAATGGDCNDLDPSVHPGAPEACNGVDDDCDHLVDCDDAVACTSDTCGPSGCAHVANASLCPDDDGNACTIPSCDPSLGCRIVPAGCDRDPRDVGYWTRLCSGTPVPGEALLPSDLECLFGLCTFSDITTVEGLCARLHPVASADPCAQADAQLLSVVLDVCRGRLSTQFPIQSGCTGTGSVADAMLEADSLLCNQRYPVSCGVARCEASEIASGRALSTDTLRIAKATGVTILTWTAPYSPDLGPPAAYRIWRRADPSQPFAMVAETTSPEWTDSSGLPRAEYEVRFVW